MPVSTVSGILTRIGLGKLSRLEPLEPAEPLRAQRPGELVHIDVKKLGRIGRGAGHRVNGRRAAQREHAPEGRVGRRLGVRARLRSTTRPGSPTSRCSTTRRPRPRSASSAAPSRTSPPSASASSGDDRQRLRLPLHRSTRSPASTLGIKHLRTRPYRPRTNGKAERFIRTLLGGWAYGAIYRNADERSRALAGWIDFYNRRRPHGSLSRQAPLERLHALNGTTSSGPTPSAGLWACLGHARLGV